MRTGKNVSPSMKIRPARRSRTARNVAAIEPSIVGGTVEIDATIAELFKVSIKVVVRIAGICRVEQKTK
jgi:hypothetical protein